MFTNSTAKVYTEDQVKMIAQFLSMMDKYATENLISFYEAGNIKQNVVEVYRLCTPFNKIHAYMISVMEVIVKREKKVSQKVSKKSSTLFAAQMHQQQVNHNNVLHHQQMHEAANNAFMMNMNF